MNTSLNTAAIDEARNLVIEHEARLAFARANLSAREQYFVEQDVLRAERELDVLVVADQAEQQRLAAEAERVARAKVSIEALDAQRVQVISRNAAVTVFVIEGTAYTLPSVSFDSMYPTVDSSFLAQVHIDPRKVVRPSGTKPSFKRLPNYRSRYAVYMGDVLVGEVQKVEDAFFGVEWVGIYNDGDVAYSADTRIDAAWRLINS